MTARSTRATSPGGSRLDGENGIIAGHGRVLAARKLGMTEVPCIAILPRVDPAQAPRCRPAYPKGAPRWR
jgi:hypothetical protein